MDNKLKNRHEKIRKVYEEDKRPFRPVPSCEIVYPATS